MSSNKLRDRIAEIDDQIMLLDPAEQFDKCILGVASRCGMDPVAVYDQQCVLTVLQEDGMSEEEAIEWFDFNIHGSYVGPQTPVYMDKIEPEGD